MLEIVNVERKTIDTNDESVLNNFATNKQPVGDGRYYARGADGLYVYDSVQDVVNSFLNDTLLVKYEFTSYNYHNITAFNNKIYCICEEINAEIGNIPAIYEYDESGNKTKLDIDTTGLKSTYTNIFSIAGKLYASIYINGKTKIYEVNTENKIISERDYITSDYMQSMNKVDYNADASVLKGVRSGGGYGNDGVPFYAYLNDSGRIRLTNDKPSNFDEPIIENNKFDIVTEDYKIKVKDSANGTIIHTIDDIEVKGATKLCEDQNKLYILASSHDASTGFHHYLYILQAE